MIIDRELREPVALGSVELIALARRTMTRLSIDVAGVDVPDDDPDAFARLGVLMADMASAATVAHAAGDKQAITERGRAALRAFDVEFYRPSLARRSELVATLDEADLPHDVLTTLLVNHDRLLLEPATILREVAYYPWVGAHSTSNQFVHAMHHLLTWLDANPDDRSRLVEDHERRRGFVHESMRLHPASPVAVRRATERVVLDCSGRCLEAGEEIVIDIEAANRDPRAVGPEPDRFEPSRSTADDVPPWGLSFGSGTHACLGRELAGGQSGHDEPGDPLLGAVTVLAGAVLGHDARLDPADPPEPDRSTTRDMWGRYPVLIG